MKKSNIVLLISLAFVMLYFLYPSAFGFINVDKQGNPTDLTSRFWYNIYPDKINLTTGQTINHIKIRGSKDATASLVIKKSTQQHLDSDDRQNFAYKIDKDTLEIQLKKGNTYLLLEQPTTIQSIFCTDQTDLKLIPVQAGDSIQQLAITLENGSMLKMGEYTKKYRNGSTSGSEGPVAIKNLHLNISKRSKADLMLLQSDNCIANLTDAYINCEQSTFIDSLQIHLAGKSTMTNMQTAINPRRPEVRQRSNESNIKHVIVSGDRHYFNKKFISPNTKITVK